MIDILSVWRSGQTTLMYIYVEYINFLRGWERQFFSSTGSAYEKAIISVA